MLDSVTRTGERAATVLPAAATLARWGPGGTVLAAGVHELLDPAAWTVYVADWLASVAGRLPDGVHAAQRLLEVASGIALLLDRYAAFASFVAAASLSATCVYLGVVWATVGAFGDVLARDVGLAGLAWAVLRASLTDGARGDDG